NYSMRSTLSVLVADMSGEAWVTLFHGELEALLGQPLEPLLHDTGSEQLTSLLQGLSWKRTKMNLRTSIPTYNERQSVKIQCNGMAKITSEFAQHLINQIEKLSM